MSMFQRVPYILAELKEVKEDYPEFRDIMADTRRRVEEKAANDWASGGVQKPNGVMHATGGQFSETTVIPALFNNYSAARLVTWRQWIGATGHQTIMTGAGAGGVIAEDYKIGFVGLAFLSKAQLLTAIRMQISDQKFPRINVEEAMAYEQPCIIFEEGWILDEETGFELYGYVECRGWARIGLIGIQLNRVPNKLQVTNTGAALT